MNIATAEYKKITKLQKKKQNGVYM